MTHFSGASFCLAVLPESFKNLELMLGYSVEMDSPAGQIPQGWCQTSRPGEVVSHIIGL